MYNTTGLSQKYLTEVFLHNAKQQLQNATSDKTIKFLIKHIAGLQYQVQSLLN